MARWVFVGAGAVGSALGGLLAKQGHSVLLVARGEHARAVTEEGLVVRCPDTRFTVSVPAVTAPDEERLTLDDVLVLTTKTQQAEAALGQWADVPVHARDGTVAGRAADLLPVLTALNGVTSEEIALRYFDRVFAVCVWFPVVMMEPGEVIVRGVPLRGVFHLGRYGVPFHSEPDARLLEAIVRDWGQAGCRVLLPDDVMAWKYRKLLSNVGNVLEALLGDTSGADGLQRAVEAEAREILTAAAIPFTTDEASRTDWHPPDLSFASVPGEPAQMGGSSWQSLARGAGTIETDYLNGEIALVARRIGRGAPLNARLTALARRAAREGLRPGSTSIDELQTQLAG